MKEKNKTLYIIVDAFRSDYLTDDKMPYISDLASKSIYIEEVVPSPGFCERVEILTGKQNTETGYFTAIDRVDPLYKSTPLLNLVAAISNLIGFIGKFFNSYLLFRLKTKLVSKILKTFWPHFNVPPYHIPPEIYGQFDLSEDAVDQSLPSAFGVPSIVDHSLDEGYTINFSAFTSLSNEQLYVDDDRMQYVEDYFHNSEDTIFFLYLGELDSMGHKWGPKSPEFMKILKTFDKKLYDFISRLENEGSFGCVIIGDHGMSDVESTVDFQKIVRDEAEQIGISVEDEITIFCDSTLGRVWLKDDVRVEALRNRLKNNPILNKYGLIFDNEDYQKYGVPMNLDLHGQIIWWANNGIVVSPDYFYGPFAPKGMHGYLPSMKDNYGIAIFSGKSVKPKKIAQAKLSEILRISEAIF